MIKLGSKGDVSKSDFSNRNECTKSSFSNRIYFDYQHSSIRSVKLYVNELSKLRESGKITDDQMITVLKYIISFLIEKEVVKRVDCAIEKSILESIS
jgi:hypothetical protein